MCLGIFVADALAKPIERIPDWRQLALVEHVELHTGGCANNSGIGLARLGLRVGVIGKVGQDGFGDFVLKRLVGEGIDIQGMKRESNSNTSFTFVMIAPDGERAFFHYVGANGMVGYEDVDFSLIEQARILLVAGTFVMPKLDGEPTAKLLKRAKEMGVVTCLDTVWNDSIDTYATLEPSLPYIDYLLPSIDEARLVARRQSPEDVAGFFLDKGVGTIALKMGREGSYLQNREQRLYVPAFKVDVVDTSGAGDAWVAGFLTGITMGWDIERAARFGSAMGGLCATAVGTTAGLKSMEETVAFMEAAEVLNTQ